MFFRVFSGMMGGLLALAAVLQYNDPDPLYWMAMYGAAAAVSLVTGVRGSAPKGIAAAVGLTAAVWAGMLTAQLPGLSVYGHMFDAWRMQSAGIEEARESLGLVMVAAWMLGITLLSQARNNGIRRRHREV